MDTLTTKKFVEANPDKPDNVSATELMATEAEKLGIVLNSCQLDHLLAGNELKAHYMKSRQEGICFVSLSPLKTGLMFTNKKPGSTAMVLSTEEMNILDIAEPPINESITEKDIKRLFKPANPNRLKRQNIIKLLSEYKRQDDYFEFFVNGQKLAIGDLRDILISLGWGTKKEKNSLTACRINELNARYNNVYNRIHQDRSGCARKLEDQVAKLLACKEVEERIRELPEKYPGFRHFGQEESLSAETAEQLTKKLNQAFLGGTTPAQAQNIFNQLASQPWGATKPTTNWFRTWLDKIGRWPRTMSNWLTGHSEQINVPAAENPGGNGKTGWSKFFNRTTRPALAEDEPKTNQRVIKVEPRSKTGLLERWWNVFVRH